jgi:hypothetical protein
MADDADRASKDTEFLEDANIVLIREQAAKIPKGVPGECSNCGEHFERLVGGHCGRCRDLLKLP